MNERIMYYFFDELEKIASMPQGVGGGTRDMNKPVAPPKRMPKETDKAFKGRERGWHNHDVERRITARKHNKLAPKPAPDTVSKADVTQSAKKRANARISKSVAKVRTPTKPTPSVPVRSSGAAPQEKNRTNSLLSNQFVLGGVGKKALSR